MARGAVRDASGLAESLGFIALPPTGGLFRREKPNALNQSSNDLVNRRNFDRSIANAPDALVVDDFVAEHDPIHDLCPQVGQIESLRRIKLGKLAFARDAGLGGRHPK